MDYVSIANEGAICPITLNRPDKRNAVHGPMAAELRTAFVRFEQDPALRVAVLTGASGHFCAGADLGAVGDPALRNELDPDGGGTGPVGPTRMVLSNPLIAAVNGYAVAGGLELALLADLRVAGDAAVFGVFCRRWGVPLIDGGTVRLPRIVGMGRALDMILTGRPVPAPEAMEPIVGTGLKRDIGYAFAFETLGAGQHGDSFGNRLVIGSVSVSAPAICSRPAGGAKAWIVDGDPLLCRQNAELLQRYPLCR